jgi:hypothetical protein
MPSKSRRDRRRISRNLQTGIPSGSIPSAAGMAAAGLAADVPAAALPVKNSVVYRQKAPLPDPAESMKYLGQELKWIAVVTLVILVLMVIAYYIFR